MNLKIIQTSDGSHTIYNSELNETYHSLHGSINESNTVYIQNGLEYYLKKKSIKKINILEVGFGTGLNFLLTHIFLEKRKEKIFYHTIEPYPLPNEVIEKLNYVSKVGEQYSEIYGLSHNLENDKKNDRQKQNDFNQKNFDNPKDRRELFDIADKIKFDKKI